MAFGTVWPDAVGTVGRRGQVWPGGPAPPMWLGIVSGRSVGIARTNGYADMRR
jgi:hypothetical protein